MKSQQLRKLAPELDSLRLGSGWKIDELSKPQIIVESSYGHSHPGSAHLDKLVDEAGIGIKEKGGRAATWLAVWQFLRLGSWPLLISVFMIVWLADACAYFAGRLFGKNRMAPAISPKKTWEGVAGGLVSVLVAALAAYLWLPHEMVLTSILLDKAGFAAGLLMILVLVAVSVSGDLFESSLKRQAGVKDSGRLLPGHGGFYDRLDSSLAVLPTAAAMLMIV